MSKSAKGRWYIKQGERVHGPFPNKLIGRYLILGRISLQTEVSQDKTHWSAVENYPAMVPDVVKEAGTVEGDRALMLARIREDERSSRSDDNDAIDDRREDEEELIQLHRQMRDDVLYGYHTEPKRRIVYISLIVLLVITLVATNLSSLDSGDARLTDCAAAAQPGINWSGCNKQGALLRNRNLQQANFRNAKLETADLSASNLQQADMAYADLTRAILVSTQLQQVNLKGADLSHANLQGANLSGANLSHAELMGSQLEGAELSSAIFDNAIWVNGQKCLPGSVGACLLAVED